MLRRHVIQQLYLDVQVILGKLIEEAGKEEKKKLAAVSVQLINIKRNMIGNYDEIEGDSLEVPVAVERRT